MAVRIRTHLRDSLFLNTYLLVAIRLLGTGLGFLFWALAARIVTADEVGIASGAISATLLLGGLGQLGLGYGLVRHLAHSDDPSGLINFSLLLSGLAGLGLALLFLVSVTIFSPALLTLRSSLVSGFTFVALVLSTTLSQLLHWVFLAKRQLVFSLMKQTIQAVSAIILLLILQSLVSGYASVITAYMLATAIGLGFSICVFLPIVQPDYGVRMRPWMSLRSSFTSYSFTNHVADQFQRAPNTLIPLIAIQQMGPRAGAYFFVAWTIGTGTSAWAGSISESLFAEGANAPAIASKYLFRALKLGILMTSGITADHAPRRKISSLNIWSELCGTGSGAFILGDLCINPRSTPVDPYQFLAHP